MSDIELKPCPFCGASLIKSKMFIEWRHPIRSVDEAGCPCAGIRIRPFDRLEIAKWNARAPSPPDGWALVPREPTETMYMDGWNAMFQGQWTGTEAALLGAGWDAMLAAAPKPPA